MTGPYVARSQRTLSLAPQSPLRPSPHLQREVQVHREGLIGELSRTTAGWVLHSKDLLLNGEPLSGTALVHGDCLETLDSRGAWIVTFDGLGEPDTGWGPLWQVFRRGALDFKETGAGLAVELHPAADSLGLLTLIMKSTLPLRLSRLTLTLSSPEHATAHRELVQRASFELTLRSAAAGRSVNLPAKAELAPHAVYPRDGRWHHVALREGDGLWTLDALEEPLKRALSDVRWFEPFFHGAQCVMLIPARSALFSCERWLRETATEATVSVFLDELIELGDPSALWLREREGAALQSLLFPFISSDAFVGGIDLAKSTHTRGFFTELHLKRWAECEAELPLLLSHPLCRGVTAVKHCGPISSALRGAFPAVRFDT